MTERDLKIEFDSILKDIVSPIFKSYGFKKQRNHFFRENEIIIQTFNVQQSQWNNAESKKFVFNTGIIEKEIHSKITEDTLPVFPKNTDADVHMRNGHIMNKGDLWYELNYSTNLKELKERVKKDISNYVITYFEYYNSPKNLLDFFDWEYEPVMSPLFKFYTIEKYGDKKDALKYLNELYLGAIEPQNDVFEMGLHGKTVYTEEKSAKINEEWVSKLKLIATEREFEFKEQSNRSNIVSKEKETKNRFWLFRNKRK